MKNNMAYYRSTRVEQAKQPLQRSSYLPPKGSRVVDELKNVIFRQNEVIEKLKNDQKKQNDYKGDGRLMTKYQNVRRTGRDERKLEAYRKNNELLKQKVEKYRRERNEMVETSKVLEEFVYVFKQERDQLQKEVHLLQSQVNSGSIETIMNQSNASELSRKLEQRAEDDLTEGRERFKYRSVFNPSCTFCSKLESKLIKQKAVNLENAEKVKVMKTKLRKNVSIYRTNLDKLGKEMKLLCTEFVDQSTHIESLKNSLTESSQVHMTTENANPA